MRTLLAILSVLAAIDSFAGAVTLMTQTATFEVGENGSLCGIVQNGRNFTAAGQPAPLLQVRVAGKDHAPDSAAWDASTKRLALLYSGIKAEAVLQVEAKPTHITLELVAANPQDKIDLVTWGPYPTTIGDIIGEVVGVVRHPEFAIGIQSLNAKTLGGYPTRENDVEADYTADDSGNYTNLRAELKKDQEFRGDTARRTEFGSVLQAFCRNRSRDRVIENWGHEKYLAPAFNDGGVLGSKIALFACPSVRALETIGGIELAGGLPHPMIDGVWGKVAPHANCAYLIVDFSEATMDQAIEMTKHAGLNYLYHSSPFETWGHFELKKSLFPHGRNGLRRRVEKARWAAVRVGFHTLFNFITPNDAYVTPKPDPRLARVGASVLTTNIDVTQKEIPIASPDYFRKQTDMNTVVSGDELIRYGSVSAEAPWRLLEDAEWMLARAAGYDAGFALAASLASTAQLGADPNSADAMKRLGSTPAILAAVRQWKTARMAAAFPPGVKAMLRDNTREFHLEPAGVGQWDLYSMEKGERVTPVCLKAKAR